MMKTIKQQNFVPRGYNRQTGEPIVEEVEEFVCAKCFFIVEKDDKFCGHCGEKLDPPEHVKHWYGNTQLTEEEFSRVKKLSSKEKLSQLNAISATKAIKPIFEKNRMLIEPEENKAKGKEK